MEHTTSSIFRATVAVAVVAAGFAVGGAASAAAPERAEPSRARPAGPVGDCDWVDAAAIAGLPVAEALPSLSELTTLMAAVSATDLGAALQSGGPFTIFAPSNAAFEGIPENVFDSIIADQVLLTSILEYHIVAGESLTAEDLVSQGTVETINGPLEIAVDGPTLVVNGGEASVTCEGIQTADATIFVIDQVLQPASAGMGTDGSSIPGSSLPGSSVPGSSVPG